MSAEESTPTIDAPGHRSREPGGQLARPTPEVDDSAWVGGVDAGEQLVERARALVGELEIGGRIPVAIGAFSELS